MSILNKIKNRFSLNYRKKRWPGLINAYKQYLPVSSKTPIVSLNEGNTPLIFSKSISNLIGNDTEVYLKYDGLNPTGCLLYTSPSPRDRTRSRMPSSA